MATYNGEKYIREQLDSILAQTCRPYEIIIQDDGSTDSTPAICRDYEARYDNVRFIQNAENLGYNRNFQSVAAKATGDFVALSDQDDVWFPEKIERLLAAIGDCDASFSPHTRGVSREGARLVDPQHSMEALMFHGFAGHTMLFRRDFIQCADNWRLPLCYDHVLEINAAMGRGIARVDEPLGWHRTNDLSACAQEWRKSGMKVAAHPTWQPYVYGISNYRRLQRKAVWQTVYRHIMEHTSDTHQPLAHLMARLMLSRSPWALLRLCWICLRHGDSIYYKKGMKGMRGRIRQLCYPLIFSYGNITYDTK